MRNKLMVTAAVAALIGCTTFAVAQEPNKGEPAKGAPAGQHAAPGGAMQHQAPPSGAAQNQAAPGEHPGSMSQGEGHAKPTTAQGAQNNEPKSGANGNNAEENAQSQERNRTQENAQSQERNRTQENAQSQERNRTQENAQSQERTKEHNGRTEKNAQTQARPDQAPENSHAAGPATGRENTAEGKGAAGGRHVQVSEQQRTRIKDIIVRDRNVPRVAHADFSVRVGVSVPRSVHVEALPTEIVEIVPEYRGFDYIVVGDQLLIVDPHTLEIVYILPA
jgi:hypothetical protein